MKPFLDANTPYILPILFIAVWCGVGFIVARTSGWSLLARRFRLETSFTGPTWSWQRAQMRYATGYNGCLIVGADPSGLYLATMFFFRIGHPPLLLPWHEVALRKQGKILWVPYVELTLGREEQIPFRIRGTLADKLKSAAGLNWPHQLTPSGR